MSEHKIITKKLSQHTHHVSCMENTVIETGTTDNKNTFELSMLFVIARAFQCLHFSYCAGRITYQRKLRTNNLLFKCFFLSKYWYFEIFFLFSLLSFAYFITLFGKSKRGGLVFRILHIMSNESKNERNRYVY